MKTRPYYIPTTSRTDEDKFLKSAKNYFTIVSEELKVEVVAPIFNEKLECINANELIPNRIVVLPKKLTLYLKETEQRFNKISPPPKVLLRTSESCIFVYAYNSQGKLIDPIYRNPTNKNICPYNIFLFRGHLNTTNADEMPVLASKDFDAKTEEYNTSFPNCNPPHAIMFKPHLPGIYSIHVSVKINDELAKKLSASQLNSQDNAADDVDIQVVDDFKSIENLWVTSSKENSLCPPSGEGPLKLNLTEEEPVELCFMGKKGHLTWTTSGEIEDKKLFIPVTGLSWIFETKDYTGDSIPALIEPLDWGNSRVRVTGLAALDKVVLAIYAYGKRWEIAVQIHKPRIHS